MNVSKDIIQKVLNDDIEGETIALLKQQLKEELSKPDNEINFENVCDIMFKISQIENGIFEGWRSHI